MKSFFKERRRLGKKLKRICDRLKKLYGSPICGRNRATFIIHDYVIKCPINESGIHDNYNEAEIYKQYGNSEIAPFPLAKCHLLTTNDIPMVLMEKVEIKPFDEAWPRWVDFVDCQQVGYNKNGLLVAYDYGNL
jgi:hypothetical protein